MTDELPDCCFDAWARANRARARRNGLSAAVTAALLDDLQEAGLRDRTVLDVGCGTGDLALATVQRGAAAAIGIDLGPGAIDDARGLAEERGLQDAVSFIVGDGSVAELPRVDVVVLNRVLCCYPDASAILDNTLPSAGSVFAMSAPVDRGAFGAFNRIIASLSNRWYAMRAAKYRGFRVAIHDLRQAEEHILREGFLPRTMHRRRFVWDVRVYERSGARASS